MIAQAVFISTGLGIIRIGGRSIVAVGAVVKDDFPAGCLIGAVPERVLRTTLSSEVGL